MEANMDAKAGFRPLPAPTHEAKEFMAYESECRSVLMPLLTELLERAVAAGWNRRTAASTMMFLSAQQVSAASEASSGG
jgi:hypothetical protein